VSGDGTVGLYRVGITLSSGTGKLKPAGGVRGAMKESVSRAFSFLSANKTPFGVARELDTSDFHVEVIDLLGNKVEAEIGVAFFVAAYSALRKAPPQAALLVLGDMSIQGNIKPVRSLTEPLQVAMDNGGKCALIPIENKRQFLEVNPDVLEQTPVGESMDKPHRQRPEPDSTDRALAVLLKCTLQMLNKLRSSEALITWQ
jgi:ATP-dependent Lon protease